MLPPTPLVPRRILMDGPDTTDGGTVVMATATAVAADAATSPTDVVPGEEPLVYPAEVSCPHCGWQIDGTYSAGDYYLVDDTWAHCTRCGQRVEDLDEC